MNQLFKNNKELLLNTSVIELINYCKSLENEIIDNKQKFTIENKLIELIKDIYFSIIDTIQEDNDAKRFRNNRIDYEFALKNLKTYLENFSKDNNFRF